MLHSYLFHSRKLHSYMFHSYVFHSRRLYLFACSLAFNAYAFFLAFYAFNSSLKTQAHVIYYFEFSSYVFSFDSSFAFYFVVIRAFVSKYLYLRMLKRSFKYYLFELRSLNSFSFVL